MGRLFERGGLIRRRLHAPWQLAIALSFVVCMVARAATPTSTATVSDVRSLTLTSGGKGGTTYTVAHDILAPLDPGASLTGARLTRVDFPAVYAGLWGPDYVSLGAWLTAPSTSSFAHEEYS